MFIGRQRELDLLKKLASKKTASFVICKGRRRIGKSRLIQEFGKTVPCYLEFQGLPPREGACNQDQLDAFATQLARQTKLPKLTFRSWAEAFSLLTTVMENKTTVLFLDEISWMGNYDKNFVGYLKIAWDTEWKKNPHLMVVVCGSVSSWIEKNILNSTGFMGRVSLELTLKELPLPHCDSFWRQKSKHISPLEKLKLLSVTGGVPRYLEEININLSAEENIKRLCFLPEGILFSEFDRIFTDIFSRRAPIYKAIVTALGKGRKTLSEVSEALGKERNGHLSDHMGDLVASGFVAEETSYFLKNAKESRRVKYRLRDNYLRFYLKYIEPKKHRIQQGLMDPLELDLATFVDWETIMGFQFENLVLNNIPEVLKRLSINGNRVKSASPYYQKKTEGHGACQIDLLIQTQYTLHVCEIKFRKVIGREVIQEVEEKIEKLSIPKSLSVRPVLIYAGELQSVVQDEGYFDAQVSFGELLEKR